MLHNGSAMSPSASTEGRPSEGAPQSQAGKPASGAFSIGGCIGVQQNTDDFPWTTLCVTGLINQACSTHQFSTCSLLKNTMHFMHRDSGNEPNTLNLIVPLSRWQGGQIWIADADGSIHLGMHGCVYDFNAGSLSSASGSKDYGCTVG